MNHYKLIVLKDDLEPGPTGYVFCNDEAEARASAGQILALNPTHQRVLVYLGDDLVCEVGRPKRKPFGGASR